MRMWRNGEDAGVIQKIIEHNFKILGRHLSQNILCLSTAERELLSSDYLSKGLRVYDITLERWFVYNGTGWDELKEEYVEDILSSDWNDGRISIPYSTHLKTNPTVQLFMKSGDTYLNVMGGVEIDTKYNVTLYSDMPYEGKVVIK